MIVGPCQSKLTPYTGLPESTSTFTLGLMEEAPQLIKNGLIFADLLWVSSQFALNFFNFYFNHNFHTQGDIFWKKFAVRAHIGIFLAFRICINFYPISKNELARVNLLSEHLGARFRAFCQISWVAEWTVWGVCQSLARNQCPRPFYHKESAKLHWHSYQKPLLLLTYFIP